MSKKAYLGDGVYVKQDPGVGIILTAVSGTRLGDMRHTIYIDGQVWEALKGYVSKLRAPDEDDSPQGIAT